MQGAPRGAAASIKEAVTAIRPERLLSNKKASGGRSAMRPGQKNTIVYARCRTTLRRLSLTGFATGRTINRVQESEGSSSNGSSSNSSSRISQAIKLKTSGRALPEVSEVKHKVAFGLPRLRAVKPFAGYLERKQYMI
jgi:hypothetical protein